MYRLCFGSICDALYVFVAGLVISLKETRKNLRAKGNWGMIEEMLYRFFYDPFLIKFFLPTQPVPECISSLRRSFEGKILLDSFLVLSLLSSC